LPDLRPGFRANDKKLFPEKLNRACSTTGSDRGSLRDHNLTLMIAALTPKHESRAMGDDVDVEERRREVE
jgi:hypothetical protein